VSAATPAQTTVITAVLLIITGNIKGSAILTNCARCFLGLRPGNGLIARYALLLAGVSPDQAGIDRKTLATDQASRNALRHQRNSETASSPAVRLISASSHL
jgi:hypothetical protein